MNFFFISVLLNSNIVNLKMHLKIKTKEEGQLGNKAWSSFFLEKQFAEILKIETSKSQITGNAYCRGAESYKIWSAPCSLHLLNVCSLLKWPMRGWEICCRPMTRALVWSSFIHFLLHSTPQIILFEEKWSSYSVIKNCLFQAKLLFTIKQWTSEKWEVILLQSVLYQF